MRGFDAAEYAGRIGRLGDRLRALGLDATVITSAPNITYLTGHPALGSAYVPQAVVVRPGDDLPHVITRPIDSRGFGYSTGLPQERRIGYPEELIGNFSSRTGHDFIFEFVADLVNGGRVGIERDSLSAAAIAKAEAALGAARLYDVSGVVNRQRMLKSPAEIAVQRQAGMISDIAMNAAAVHIRPGMRECDLAAEVIAALVRGTPDYCGDWPQYPEITTGKRLGSPHLSWHDGVFAEDAQINIELGAFRFRYACGLTRVLQIGEASAKLLHLHDATVEAMEAVIPMLTAGTVCEDIWHRLNSALARHGYHKPSRCGYSMGIEWDDMAAGFAPGDTTPLESGMVFHLMLGMWTEEEWGYQISETFVIGEGKPETLSRMPRHILQAGQCILT